MTPRPSTVKYDVSSTAWKRYQPLLMDLVRTNKLRRVCDVGGGANPGLPSVFVDKSELEYTLLDISAKELDKAPYGHHKVVADIASVDFPCDQEYDLVFSRMLAEHVKDGEQMHRNVFSILASGGHAVHFFPTLYAFPFVVNRLIPEVVASTLLDIVSPRDRYQHEKFPAYYSWCRGPTTKQLDRLADLGYEIVEYTGYFGHAGYYRRVPFLKSLSEKASGFLARHPWPVLTSYAQVVLRRPRSD